MSVKKEKKETKHKWQAQVQQIFGIPVWVTEPYSFSDKEKRFIKKIYIDGDLTSNKGDNKTSKNSYLLDEKELKDIRYFVLENIDAFWHGFLKADPSIKLKLTQSWANYNEKNTHHHSHSHPNSIVSGVMYLQNTAPIIFERSYHNNFWPQFHFNHTGSTIFNSSDITVNTENGVLLLFPSTTFHRVSPNTSENCRISISLNTFPMGTLGEKEKLTQLKLDELKDRT